MNDFVLLDLTGFDQDKINMIPALSYSMAVSAGYDIVPKVNNEKVTFPGIQIDPSQFLDTPKYTNKYDSWKAEQDQAIAAEEAKQAAYEAEKASNSVYKANSLTEIDNAIEACFGGSIVDILSLKQATITALKIVAKCDKIR